MAVVNSNLNSAAGLKKLDEYLLTRSYISGYQASKDDLTVYAALLSPPSAAEYVNASRWFFHIDALLRLSGVTSHGCGVKVEGFAPVEQASSPDMAVADDDDEIDLFDDKYKDILEKIIAYERQAIKLNETHEKKPIRKSLVVLDVKPLDDETDMKKLEETVKSIEMRGLTWGASKLVPVAYGIKKLQVTITIIDDLVSIGNLIEEKLSVEPVNEYVKSCDIVAFNKI